MRYTKLLFTAVLDPIMNSLITAAQSNDVGRLRQLLENKKIAQSPSYFPNDLLHEACEAAARNNHPEALEVLLDEGIEIERGESFEQLIQTIMRN